MNFSAALTQIKEGFQVKRAGWNGKGQYIYLLRNIINTDLPPFIVIKTIDETLVPWVASQTDLLAEDWEVVAA